MLSHPSSHLQPVSHYTSLIVLASQKPLLTFLLVILDYAAIITMNRIPYTSNPLRFIVHAHRDEIAIYNYAPMTNTLEVQESLQDSMCL